MKGPSSCIHRYAGYHLHEGEGGKPLISRRWISRGKNPEPKVDRFSAIEQLPARIRLVLEPAWKEWVAWRDAQVR